MALLAPGLYSRIRTMLPELVKFGIVGGIGTVIDLGGAALLHGKYHVEPLAAKAVSTSLATVLTYLGSRFWTFKHRENQELKREAVLFIGLNAVQEVPDYPPWELDPAFLTPLKTPLPAWGEPAASSVDQHAERPVAAGPAEPRPSGRHRRG